VGDDTVDAPAGVERVQVLVGQRILAVPTNQLNGVLLSSDQVDGVYVVDPLLLVGSAPKFEGRSAANEHAFTAPGSEWRIYARLDRVLRRTPEASLALIRNSYLDGKEISSINEGPDTHLVMQSIRPGQYNSNVGDVILAKDGSFTVCSRTEEVIRFPSCSMFMVHGPNILTIRFGRGQVRQREAIRLIVQKKIDHWSGAARS
jgi:hypothetical protein